MKLVYKLIIVTFTFISFQSFATGFTTIVGELQKTQKKIAFIKTSKGGVVKVPVSVLNTPTTKGQIGKQVIAKLPFEMFVALNP